jgi:hypothetical protein
VVEPPPAPAPAPEDIDAEADCSQQEDDAKAFLTANKACKSDADCTNATAGCYPEAEDCCVVYVNKQHDAAKWKALTDAIATCTQGPGGGACGCCAAIPHPAKCVNGQCG